MKLVEGGVPIKFLSTPSARRATGKAPRVRVSTDISIHALREEGDETCRICQIMEYNFYPRPP